MLLPHDGTVGPRTSNHHESRRVVASTFVSATAATRGENQKATLATHKTELVRHFTTTTVRTNVSFTMGGAGVIRNSRERRSFQVSRKVAMHLAPADHDSIADTASIESLGSLGEDHQHPDQTDSVIRSSQVACDACSNCADTCGHADCIVCIMKIVTPQTKGSSGTTCFEIQPGLTVGASYTMCQVRRHNHEGSAWLVAGNTIYDATTYMHSHPGGVESILRKAGGVEDCTKDLEFHSRAGKSAWKKYTVGQLRRCSCSAGLEAEENHQWWMFWSK